MKGDPEVYAPPTARRRWAAVVGALLWLVPLFGALDHARNPRSTDVFEGFEIILSMAGMLMCAVAMLAAIPLWRSARPDTRVRDQWFWLLWFVWAAPALAVGAAMLSG